MSCRVHKHVHQQFHYVRIIKVCTKDIESLRSECSVRSEALNMSSVLKGEYSRGYSSQGNSIFSVVVWNGMWYKRTGGCLVLLECRTWEEGWWELRLKAELRAMSWRILFTAFSLRQWEVIEGFKGREWHHQFFVLERSLCYLCGWRRPVRLLLHHFKQEAIRGLN